MFKGKDMEPMLDRYVLTLFFVIQTVAYSNQITTTGYGDIQAHSNAEMAFRGVLIFTGVIVYSICIGEFSDYLHKKIDKMESEDRKRKTLFKIADHYGVCRQTVETVSVGIGRTGAVSDFGHIGELDFSMLTIEEIELFYYGLFKQKFKAMKMFESDDPRYILKLGLSLRKVKFAKGQLVYSKFQPAAGVYLLAQGKVGFMLESVDSVPFYRVDRGFFGEYELIYNVARQFSVRALTDCTLYLLPTEMFKDLFLQSDINNRVAIKAADRQQQIDHENRKFERFIRKTLEEKRIFKMKSNILEDIFKLPKEKVRRSLDRYKPRRKLIRPSELISFKPREETNNIRQVGKLNHIRSESELIINSSRSINRVSNNQITDVKRRSVGVMRSARDLNSQRLLVNPQSNVSQPLSSQRDLLSSRR